jgi:hypothetical protein
MKSIQISKNRVREYLAEKLAKNVLQSEVSDLVLVLRYNALGGFEFLSDEDLFENLLAALPELELVRLIKSDENYLYLSVKPQNKEEEEDILNDIKKIIQLMV